MAMIKRYSLFLLLVMIISNASFGQKIGLDQFKSWKPRNIGPAGMSGRITWTNSSPGNPGILVLQE